MKVSVLTPFQSRNGKVFQAGDVIDAEPEKVEILVRDGLVTPLSDDRPPVLAHCGDCALFVPDPINPPAGYGECGQTGKGFYPAPRSSCQDFLPGPPLSQVEAQGEIEILRLIEETPPGLPLDLLIERLPFPRREIGRTLSILQGRSQVFVDVRGSRSFYRLSAIPSAVDGGTR